MATLEASTRIEKGFVKSGGTNIGRLANQDLISRNACSVSLDHSNFTPF